MNRDTFLLIFVNPVSLIAYFFAYEMLSEAVRHAVGFS